MSGDDCPPSRESDITLCPSIEVELLSDQSIRINDQNLLSFFSTPLSLSSSLPSHPPSPKPPPPPTPLAELSTRRKHPCPCEHTDTMLPQPSSKWPQPPLLLRPTPNSNTRIRGIRYSSSNEYILPKGFCLRCTLPFNDGLEPPGKSLVIDFETDLFIGTILFRIRTKTINSSNYNDDDKSYFHNKKRTFQAIVQGRFLSPIPATQCVTGQIFNNPPEKMPPTWIVQSTLKFISTLAPQLDAQLNKTPPSHFLSPLCSTAQIILQSPIQTITKNRSASIEERDRKEPHKSHPTSILQTVPSTFIASGKRKTNQKIRKKTFDSLHTFHHHKSSTSTSSPPPPMFSTQQEYTFEFYQNLLDLRHMTMNLGIIQKYSLVEILNGQPIQFMAGWKKQKNDGKLAVEAIDWLWNFEIWNECLLEKAVGGEFKFDQN